jgi:hypothetical protein
MRASGSTFGAAALLLALLFPCADAVGAQAGELAGPPGPAAGRRAWRVQVPWTDACETAFQNGVDAASEDADAGVEVVPLGPNRALLRIDCDRAAYQVSQVFAVWDGTAASGRLLDFGGTAATAHNTGEPEEGSEARPVVVGLATVDPAAGELTVLTRFRGAGDCGALATYALLDGAVALRRLRLQETCDGASADPEQWPEVDASYPMPAPAPAGAAP